jgi:dihydrofolate synthase / folylpolyglutamate synthase
LSAQWKLSKVRIGWGGGLAPTISPVEATAWLAARSPWPEEFGTDRMRSLLSELGEPQRRYRAIHVVGTNGKSTATRSAEELLLDAGFDVGAYLSPHVRGWSERIRVHGEEADFERAVQRIRPAADRLGATQFEAVTAAALLEFAEAGVDAAVVEAGLGGRYDATNVIDAPVVLLTNVGLDHTEVLGETREAIAAEKLAVARPGAVVVLPDDEFAHLVPDARVIVGAAREAAEAFAGRALSAGREVALPGRLERRGADELWDGAHNVPGVEWLLERLPADGYTIVASILRDKDVDGMLERLARAGSTLVATASTNARALPAAELGRRAERWFDRVEVLADPHAALERARQVPPVLVTGSLYLLTDLAAREDHRVE